MGGTRSGSPGRFLLETVLEVSVHDWRTPLLRAEVRQTVRQKGLGETARLPAAKRQGSRLFLFHFLGAVLGSIYRPSLLHVADCVGSCLSRKEIGV